jgi:hypothetical protein
MMAIPFNRSGVVGRDLETVVQAVASGPISDERHFTRQVQALLE